METKIVPLSQDQRTRFIALGIYFSIGSMIGLFFACSGIYSLLFTLLAFAAAVIWAYSGLYYFLSINKTFLQISDSNIRFIFPFGQISAGWEDIK